MTQIRTSKRLFGFLTAALLTLALAGCGSSSSGISPAAYVKSVCGTAATWYRTIQSAGGTLTSALHSSGSTSQIKTSYVNFVTGLSQATRTAESRLRAAGTPSVKGGKQIANALVGAFTSASHGLSLAALAANKLPTTSRSAFDSAASQVQIQVQRALASMTSVAPQNNPQLHAAAAKDPTCQQLKTLG